MGRHCRIEAALDEGTDPLVRLDELERALVETLAEVELGRRGRTYPWDAERRGKHAAPARGVCVTCNGAVVWQDHATGGWWIHEAHLGDQHTATVAA